MEDCPSIVIFLGHGLNVVGMHPQEIHDRGRNLFWRAEIYACPRRERDQVEVIGGTSSYGGLQSMPPYLTVVRRFTMALTIGLSERPPISQKERML